MSNFIKPNCDDSIFKTVDEYEYVDTQMFRGILFADRPAIMKNCSFGDSMQKWNLEYLTEKLKDVPVVIHQSNYKDLDFIDKNFKYETCFFSKFAEKLKSHDPKLNVYLRSTNWDPRAQKPAKIENDFPKLKQDLKLPLWSPFTLESEMYHSSVLRIASSNVQIWTHFDLYRNVLCQVVGTKRVILFHPDDTKHLYVRGDKSTVNNFDDWEACLSQFPSIEKTKPYKCLLKPGDTLFIPTLWWHNIRTISESSDDNSYSIGFNIFWKDQLITSPPIYADHDVYGNKNLKTFDSVLAKMNKAVDQLETMPEKYRAFYKSLLLAKLTSRLSL